MRETRNRSNELTRDSQKSEGNRRRDSEFTGNSKPWRINRRKSPHDRHSRIDLGHLKTEIVKKLGAESSKLYFFYLNRFLSLKITKVEFDKICFRVVGRENVALHNQLITSILLNAYNAKAPPDFHVNEVCKPKFKGLDEKPLECARSLLKAPHGVSVLALARGRGFVSSCDFGGLLGSEGLRCCMEEIAMKEGLEGVSLDCANLVNCALDCYLRRIIKGAVELAGSSSRSEPSVLDLRAAMELDPQKLGEDWPLLLEKMCDHS